MMSSRKRIAIISTAVGSLALAAPFTALAQDWDALAECESGGDWSTDTGNGYSGGIQFSPETWEAHGGSGDPSNASREEQIAVGERVLESQGPGAWPSCSANTGWHGGSTGGGSSSEGSQGSSEASESTGNNDEESSVEVEAEVDIESQEQSSSNEVSVSAQITLRAEPAGPGEYVIVEGDTLAKIAVAHNTDWVTLFDLNTNVVDDPNLIYPEEIVKVK